jgi:hypothetical protein
MWRRIIEIWKNAGSLSLRKPISTPQEKRCQTRTSAEPLRNGRAGINFKKCLHRA